MNPDPDYAPYTGAIPVVQDPDPYTDAIPVIAAPEPALVTGAIPLVSEPHPVTGAIPVVQEPEPATGAIPLAVEPEPVTDAIPLVHETEPLTGPITVITEAIDAATPPPLDQWQFAPYMRWSMQHIEDFLPVRRIHTGHRTSPLGQRDSKVAALDVGHPWEDRSATFSEVMHSTHTEGWMVMHRGTVVAEEYIGEFAPPSMHLLMSVSKSLTATTAGLLADRGDLDLERPVTDYVPALAGSGYDGVLVRHLVDMRTGVRFSEEYLNDDAEVRLLEEAIGWAPKRHADVPDSLLGFLATLGQQGPHGGAFDYKSCETDALGFVIGGAAGVHAGDAMSELLWAPMGAEFDAHVGVDSVGAGMFDGGVSAALRDLARFGHLFVNGGRTTDGVQVLPEWWVADTFAGGPDSRQAFEDAPEPTFMPGGMYRNGFWFPGESDDVMLALGIHGQMIYINRATGVIGVKVSSWPTPQDPEKLFWTVRAFETASRALDAGEA